MTTTVKVSAHCSSSKEVEIVLTDGPTEIEKVVIQDGQTAERYVYDGRSISVQEVEKQA